MALIPYYLADHTLLVTQVRGVLDDESLVRYYRGICASPRVGLDIPELLDLTEISVRSTVGEKGFQKVSRIVKATYGDDAEPSASASVAPNLLVFGMMRMYEMGFSPEAMKVRTFRDFAPALEWLDRDPALAPLIRTLDPSHTTVLSALAVGASPGP
jgi:hypothetical protein